MRITINVTSPEAVEADLRLITLDVFPDMTLGALRSSVESEGIPSASQHIYHNGNLVTDDTKTLTELQIPDGEMLMLHVRHPAQPAQSRRPPGPPATRNAEHVRQQLLRSSPETLARARHANPPLIAALNDPEAFSRVYNQANAARIQQWEQRQWERDQLNNDEFNPEAQARIEQMIRQERVIENMQDAIEYNPESFGRVHMLYVVVKVNGVQVKAMVDSGAQATIMSPTCAEACNIMKLVDHRFSGVARGVGTATIVGRVHNAVLQLGSKHLHASFTVMEGKSVDLLLGLDILKGHQAIIDLCRGKLIIQGEEIDFLAEADIPKDTEEAVNREPTVQGPAGTTIGQRSGAVTAPAGSTAGPPNLAHRAADAPPAVSTAAPANLAAQVDPPAAASSSHPVSQAVDEDPNAPPPSYSYPEEDINTLMGLGFDRATSVQALSSAEGNLELAAGLLFQRM